MTKILDKRMSSVTITYKIKTDLKKERLVFVSVNSNEGSIDLGLGDIVMKSVLEQRWLPYSITDVIYSTTSDSRGMTIKTFDVVHLNEICAVGESVGLVVSDVRYLDDRYWVSFRRKKVEK